MLLQQDWQINVKYKIAYAIGIAEPVSIMVDTFGTSKVNEEKIEDKVRKSFDMRPAGIIKMLDLKRPIYKRTGSIWSFR